jgi:hypothetical protein
MKSWAARREVPFGKQHDAAIEIAESAPIQANNYGEIIERPIVVASVQPHFGADRALEGGVVQPNGFVGICQCAVDVSQPTPDDRPLRVSCRPLASVRSRILDNPRACCDS